MATFAPPATLEAQAAQLLFPRIGSNMPPPKKVAADVDRLADLIGQCPIGGLVLFNGDRTGTPDALRALQERSSTPLLIASDIERGAGQQLHGWTVFPHAEAYTALGDDAERLLEASAQATAREALGTGVHVSFSPVADVNLDPRNPIIATRAFGSDPEVAARLVRAYVRGCQGEGMSATAKHFPGHGNTHQDSHDALPHVTSSRDELRANDLVPFQAAVDSGVDLIMTAHCAYPALDPSEAPATASAPILNGLLRRSMGFTGAVVSDSLLMGGIRDRYPDAGTQAVELVRAGVDLLLDVADPLAATQGLVRAVREGQLDPERLAEASARVWRLKERLFQRFGLSIFTDPDPQRFVSDAGAHQRLAEEVARRAIVADVRDEGAWPVDPGGGADIVAIYLKSHATPFDQPEEPLAAALRDHFQSVRYLQLEPDADEAAYEAAFAACRGAAHVLVAGVVKPSAWHGFGLKPRQQAFAEALAQERPVVLAVLGSPLALRDLPASVWVCTYSDVPVSQRALAAWYAGRS